MVIRNLQASDIPKIAELITATPELAVDRLSVQWLFSEFFSGTSFIALSPDGGIQGFLYGFVDQDSPSRAFIYELGVAPASRRQGVGSALIDAFRNEVSKRDVSSLFLTTLPTNASALEFYGKLGFSRKQIISKVGQERIALFYDF